MNKVEMRMYELIPEPRIDNVRTGKSARWYREGAKLSLRFVARKMKISASYLSDLELGRRGWNADLFFKFREVVDKSGQKG